MKNNATQQYNLKFLHCWLRLEQRIGFLDSPLEDTVDCDKLHGIVPLIIIDPYSIGPSHLPRGPQTFNPQFNNIPGF